MLLLKFGSIDYEYELVWQSVFLQFKGRFLQRKCARRVWLFYMCGGLNGCIRFWVWRVRGSNLHFTAPNDGTVSQWTPPRAAGEAILNGLAIPWWISLCWCWWLSLLEAIIFCSVLQSLEVLFFPGTRGSHKLSPLIPYFGPLTLHFFWIFSFCFELILFVDFFFFLLKVDVLFSLIFVFPLLVFMVL